MMVPPPRICSAELMAHWRLVNALLDAQEHLDHPSERQYQSRRKH